MTCDLFAPALAGLAIEQGLVSAGDEAKLIALLGELELAPFRFQGWTGNRLTRSFGWRYDFDDRSFSETDPCRPGSIRSASSPGSSRANPRLGSATR